MDTYSAAEVARRLSTTVPRVVRAAERLGLDARTPTKRWKLTGPMVDRLAAELGSAPRIAGLSEMEGKVLAALSRAPFGLASARVAAGQAGVSPTGASTAIRSLVVKGLAYREPATIAAGRAREVELVHANRLAPAWLELAPKLAATRPPDRPIQSTVVPPRLRHLFWNTAPSQLDIEKAGRYIARRLITTGDLEGLAWGAEHLAGEHWRQAAKARGLDRRARALALNLAGAR